MAGVRGTGPGPSLRLAFLGSPAFAVPTLDALHAAGHRILAVYAQPPRPAGRGQRTVPCAVHARAEALGLPVRNPPRLRREEAEWACFRALDLDAAVVAAYGLILPQEMLDAPRRGCLNVHASLLPRWRGAAPIQAAIRAGDAETGVTIMRMEAGLDTGPAMTTGAVPIEARDTAPDVTTRLAALGARLMLETLRDDPPAVAQPDAGVTYAPKLTRADARIDWTATAASIDRQVRALTPWPGTETTLPDGERLKILAGEPVTADGASPPGTVLEDATGAPTGLAIACGDGAFRLLLVQRDGRPATDAGTFLRGGRLAAGARLGAW